ncbi:hypothetical protein V2G26_005332 [Clonostachys chloroleuca]
MNCVVCNAVFTRQEHLRRHMLRHIGDKPFKCPDCDHCFARKDALHRHQTNIHHHDRSAAPTLNPGVAPAAAVEAAAPSRPARLRSRARRACTACSRVKLRCDGKHPCSRCQDDSQLCHYRPLKSRVARSFETHATNGPLDFEGESTCDAAQLPSNGPVAQELTTNPSMLDWQASSSTSDSHEDGSGLEISQSVAFDETIAGLFDFDYFISGNSSLQMDNSSFSRQDSPSVLLDLRFPTPDFDMLHEFSPSSADVNFMGNPPAASNSFNYAMPSPFPPTELSSDKETYSPRSKHGVLESVLVPHHTVKETAFSRLATLADSVQFVAAIDRSTPYDKLSNMLISWVEQNRRRISTPSPEVPVSKMPSLDSLDLGSEAAKARCSIEDFGHITTLPGLTYNRMHLVLTQSPTPTPSAINSLVILSRLFSFSTHLCNSTSSISILYFHSFTSQPSNPRRKTGS